MRFAVALPSDQVQMAGDFLMDGALGETAAAIEEAGLDGCFVTDHPAPDDRWLAGGGHHALEPTVALSFAAAATTRLRLITNIYVLGYRNPLLAAKSLASLDVLSGGRLTVGVAAGYLRSEFHALGAGFDERNSLLDSGIEVLIEAWRGESVVGSGRGWSARGATILPRPLQRPHPPIWCGGNSRAAIRRAVRFADAWLPFPTPAGLAGAARTAEIRDTAALATRIEMLRAECGLAGRDEPPEVCFAPFAAVTDPGFVDEVGELGRLGVSWCMLTLPTDSRARWTDEVANLAAAVRTT